MKSELVQVELLALNHSREAGDNPTGKSHAFVYQLRISNHGDQLVVLDRRKWILDYGDGSVEVYEGDGIVGKILHLSPGQFFEYSSYHLVERSCSVTGAYHGHSQSGDAIWVAIPPFDLKVSTPEAE
jgi:ApaG protein